MRRLVLVVLLVCALAAACGDEDPAVSAVDDGVPAGEPAIVGEITVLDGGHALVESADGDKGSLAIVDDTTILPDGRELEVGQTVSVWVSGPIAESFPWQATADVVRIEP